MNKNIKQFLIKVIILVAAIFISRVIFQFPVEYFDLDLLKQSELTRLFSKIDALQVTAFLAVFFGFYYKERIQKLEHPKTNMKSSVLFVIGAEIVIALYYITRASANYYNVTGGLLLYLIQAAILFLLALAFLFFALAVFQPSYLKKFIIEFKKELPIFAILGVVMYLVLMWWQKQWYFFSYSVSKILHGLISFLYGGLSYYEIGIDGPLVGLKDFIINIGPPCSGIDSMFLFIAFSAAIFALDHKRIKKSAFFISSAIGFLGVYLVNVIRLLLLVLAGVYISPEFSVGLFHTNAGWILFIIYFLAYYLVIRKFIYIDRVAKVSRAKK
ncbi:archaeosortase/exosortase family protein [Candidatus Woesearchaeota archaeon]|nr:archaeosortase/exosortase family protein [Candidatus Woesearchaeota archaeon]